MGGVGLYELTVRLPPQFSWNSMRASRHFINPSQPGTQMYLFGLGTESVAQRMDSFASSFCRDCAALRSAVRSRLEEDRMVSPTKRTMGGRRSQDMFSDF